MITRTAVFEGVIRAGCEERFFADVAERVAPLWRRFPHAIDVRWWRVDARDAGAPGIVMIQQIDYPSTAAMQEALASPARDAARAATMELMTMFDGRFYHFVGTPGGAGQGA